ncbi:MAG: hypothetical protein R2706_12920 [Acidimicrobiales bacterium]
MAHCVSGGADIQLVRRRRFDQAAAGAATAAQRAAADDRADNDATRESSEAALPATDSAGSTVSGGTQRGAAPAVLTTDPSVVGEATATAPDDQRPPGVDAIACHLA